MYSVPVSQFSAQTSDLLGLLEGLLVIVIAVLYGPGILSSMVHI